MNLFPCIKNTHFFCDLHTLVDESTYVFGRWCPPFFFCHLRRQHKKEGLSPPLPHDHSISHILGRGWSWRTIRHSIPSHFAARFQRLFHIGAATRALGARSVDKGQIWGEFEANFGATPALGVISSSHRPPAHRSRRITVRCHGERWGRAGPALMKDRGRAL